MKKYVTTVMANYRMFVVCSKENDEEKKPIVAFNVYYDDEKQKTEFFPVVLDGRMICSICGKEIKDEKFTYYRNKPVHISCLKDFLI